MLGAGLALLLGGGVARSHPLAPALLELRELGAGRIEVRFKTSTTRLPGARIAPVLPEGCSQSVEPERRIEGSSVIERYEVVCTAETLVGQRVGVEGLDRGRIDALLRIELTDGRRMQSVLRGSAPSYVVPERRSRLDVGRSYAALGIEHIATGLDHLLFVFGLLLLVKGVLGDVVRTVTAFTVGHSVTLSLAALGLVRFPTGPIELAIAVSVLLLAVELARPAGASATALGRRPWAMAAGFGLLHGLGFAGALAAVGLPAEEIPLSLFAFNVGIEVGQLVFVITALALWGLLRPRLGALPGWTRAVPVYGLGALAAYWCLQRTAELAS